MANGIAIAHIAGNVTRDPELNDSGKVLSFGVACNRRERNADGEYEDAVSFFDVKVLGARAKGLGEILSKGEKVTVYGDLVQERWTTDDDQKRSAVRILAREVVLGGSAQRSEDASEPEPDNTSGW